MYTRILLTLCLVGLIQCQDYDQDDLGRRLHRRPRPSYQNQGPCGRDANGEGRFFNLQYVNLNYNYNCGGGYGGQGHYQQPQYTHPQPQQPIHRPPLFSGGGHYQRPQRPFKPHKPVFGNLFGQGGQHGGLGGGLGQHGGGLGQFGGGLGQLGAGLGQYAGGALSNVVPSVTGALQDAASQAGNYLNRPNFQPFRPGSGNDGPLGLGAFDGSIINSFVGLFRPNSNRPVPSSPSSPSSTGVQYLDELNNNNVNNNDNNSGSIDEKPVHEDPDEIVEAYSNSKAKKMISAFGPSYYAPYNRIIRGINKEFIHLFS